MRVFVVRRVQRDDIGTRQKIVQRRIGEFQNLAQKRILLRIENDHVHTESARDLDDMKTDMSRADHTDRFAFQIEPLESIDGKIIAQPPHMGLVNIAGERQNERKRVLRHRVFPVGRNRAHHDVPLRACRKINVVKTRGSRRDHAQRAKLRENICGNCAVDEDGDDIIILHVFRLRAINFLAGEKEIMSRKGLFEIILLPILNFKKSDFHVGVMFMTTYCAPSHRK